MLILDFILLEISACGIGAIFGVTLGNVLVKPLLKRNEERFQKKMKERQRRWKEEMRKKYPGWVGG